MSLIFDSFPDMAQALAFRDEVKKRFGLDGQLFDNEDEAQAHDPFPWEQRPPIVHIDRVDWVDEDTAVVVAAEKRVEDLVEQFGGVFAGT